MVFYIGRYKGIEKKEYNIEVVTPMFLGGNEGRKAELRVPPFKSLMRYWWRAINPHLVNNNNDFEKLAKGESSIFGDSGDIGKSRVKIKLESKNFQPIQINPLPHKERVRFRFSAIPSGHHFKLILIGPEEIHYLFKFVSYVGGVGKRCRRGFGSFRILNDDISINVMSYLFNLLKDKLKNDNYEYVTNEIKLRIDVKDGYPFLKRISLGSESGDFNKLLIKIGEASHKYNSDYTGYVKKVNNKSYRLASPAYITIGINKNKKYQIIISEFNFSSDIYNKVDRDEYQNFINHLSINEVSYD